MKQDSPLKLKDSCVKMVGVSFQIETDRTGELLMSQFANICQYPGCMRDVYPCKIMNCALCKIHCKWGLSN